ncbi:MAG: GGDEF domain-containing protein [Deltaproteobacteria bacterium]|nr:MAG: GGDEF domain-containing protein [Deltaproteobacteria bacterium]
MTHDHDSEKDTEKDFEDQTIVTSIPDLNNEKEKHAYIIFLSGPLMGKIHLLSHGTVSLGRSNDVTIPINDLGISRFHAAIDYKNGHALLKDMGSTNGTYLNGQKVQSSELQDGDKIQISSSTILKYAYQDNIENIFHNELYKMAVVDALTGAYNKRYFEERLQEEFSYCIRNEVPLTLMMFDLDHFKNINDTYGHPAGDFVLEHISTLAKSIIRSEDILARVGGEEFIILLKATDIEGGLILAERLRRLVDESQFEFEGNTIHVTVSMGVATLNKKTSFSDAEALLKRADELLYNSKNSGRNQVSH